MIDTQDIRIQTVAQSKIQDVDFENLPFGRIFSDHMFTADYQQGQWQDLQITPYATIALTPALMALHYGQSIFEGMKAYRTTEGKVVLFRPEENFKRMALSAQRMCMAEPTEEVFMGGLTRLLALDQEWVPRVEGATLYVRPFMFASDEFIGMQASETYKFVIFTCPVSAYYSGSVKVKIETHYVRAAAGGVGFAKTAGNYAASLYPARLAQEQGYHQLVWTDAKEHKYIEESGTMNVMFVIDGKVITPPASDTILPGITRKSMLTLAQDWGYIVEERPVSVDEVIAALKKGTLQEAFGVGTAATVTPIETIGHEETDYQLPPMQADGFGLRAKKYLVDLCRGEAEDQFGWLYYI